MSILFTNSRNICDFESSSSLTNNIEVHLPSSLLSASDVGADDTILIASLERILKMSQRAGSEQVRSVSIGDEIRTQIYLVLHFSSKKD